MPLSTHFVLVSEYVHTVRVTFCFVGFVCPIAAGCLCESCMGHMSFSLPFVWQSAIEVEGRILGALILFIITGLGLMTSSFTGVRSKRTGPWCMPGVACFVQEQIRIKKNAVKFFLRNNILKNCCKIFFESFYLRVKNPRPVRS